MKRKSRMFRGAVRIGFFVRFLLPFLLLVVGCGGGTSGTGGRFGISGTLRAPGGTPLAGVTVSVGDSSARDASWDPEFIQEVAVTDELGEFSLSLLHRPDTLVLHFNSLEISEIFTFSNIPISAHELNLVLEYDESGNIVEIEHATDAIDENEDTESVGS